MQWRALSFDAYGTLLAGGTDDLVRLLSERARVAGLDPARALAARERLVARLRDEPFRTLEARDRWILANLAEDPGLPVDPEKDARALAVAHAAVAPYAGVRTTLDALDHVPRALVTNADTAVIATLLDRHGLDFDAVVTSEEVRAYKPDPAPFLLAARRLGVDPREMLHVGDSFTADVVGAKRAGLGAAWLMRPDGLPAPLAREVEPDLVLARLDDLVARFPRRSTKA